MMNKRSTRKYFEIDDPYWCLIVARSKDMAALRYMKDIDPDETYANIEPKLKEVSRDHALTRFILTEIAGSDRFKQSVKTERGFQAVKDFQKAGDQILLVSGELL